MLKTLLSIFIIAGLLSGCAVIAVADTAITVASATAKVGVTVIGTAVDITATGARAATGAKNKD